MAHSHPPREGDLLDPPFTSQMSLAKGPSFFLQGPRPSPLVVFEWRALVQLFVRVFSELVFFLFSIPSLSFRPSLYLHVRRIFPL